MSIDNKRKVGRFEFFSQTSYINLKCNLSNKTLMKLRINKDSISANQSKEDILRAKVDVLLRKIEEMREELEELKNKI